MRLHYHPLSSYSRKVAIGIGLRGDAVELHTLDVFAGELRTDAFRALSPFGKMPVLELDDGTTLFESTSILEYLEERGPRRLVPQGQERRARHLDRLADLYLLTPIGKFFWDKSDATREAAEASSKSAWAIWMRELEDGREFLCGDDITLPDIGAAIGAYYAATEGLPMPEPILRYRDRLEAHPVLRASSEAAAPFVESTKPRRLKAA
jgi:glutathione S-transferase